MTKRRTAPFSPGRFRRQCRVGADALGRPPTIPPGAAWLPPTAKRPPLERRPLLIAAPVGAGVTVLRVGACQPSRPNRFQASRARPPDRAGRGNPDTLGQLPESGGQAAQPGSRPTAADVPWTTEKRDAPTVRSGRLPLSGGQSRTVPGEVSGGLPGFLPAGDRGLAQWLDAVRAGDAADRLIAVARGLRRLYRL